MVRWIVAVALHPVRIPHPRGDGPKRLSWRGTVTKYSPPAWGWSGREGEHERGAGVFPTRVGMVRFRNGLRRFGQSIPHPRGDGPSSLGITNIVRLYSPPAWGWSALFVGNRGRPVVFPTRVGMVRLLGGDTGLPQRIPHPRGDGPTTANSAEQVTLYSPPAWGWSVQLGEQPVGVGVFPTRVGMVRGPSGD